MNSQWWLLILIALYVALLGIFLISGIRDLLAERRRLRWLREDKQFYHGKNVRTGPHTPP